MKRWALVYVVTFLSGCVLGYMDVSFPMALAGALVTGSAFGLLLFMDE